MILYIIYIYITYYIYYCRLCVGDDTSYIIISDTQYLNYTSMLFKKIHLTLRNYIHFLNDR